MPGKNGSVLAITMVFVLAFTLFGFEAIYFSGLQGEAIQKKISSTQAFWIAEGGIQKAILNLTNNDATLNGLLGEGSYNISINFTPPMRWSIESEGLVSSAREKLLAEIATNSVVNAVTTKGGLSTGGSSSIDGPVESNASFSFDDVFGINEVTMQNKSKITPPNNFLTCPKSQGCNNPSNISNITWIDGSLKTSGSWAGSGILIVNGDLTMNGGQFLGVVWVGGNVTKISGSNVIVGSIFINSTKNLGGSDITGNSAIVFNASVVDNSFSSNNLATAPRIVLWRQID